jgi:hypothetical protein
MTDSRGYGVTSILKRLVTSVVIVCIGCSAVPARVSHQPEGPIPTSSGSWPMYQLQPDHNAIIRSTPMIAKWEYKADGRINGGLAVVGDLLVLDTLAGSVIALNVHNGDVVWKVTADNEVMSSPVIVHGRVFVGTGSNGSIDAPERSFVYERRDSGPLGNLWGRIEGEHVTMEPAVRTCGATRFAGAHCRRLALAVDLSHPPCAGSSALDTSIGGSDIHSDQIRKKIEIQSLDGSKKPHIVGYEYQTYGGKEYITFGVAPRMYVRMTGGEIYMAFQNLLTQLHYKQSQLPSPFAWLSPTTDFVRSDCATVPTPR